MPRAPFIASIFLVLFAFVPGCGDECSRAGDCPLEEVCRLGVCTAAQSGYLRCSSSADCGGADGSVFQCIGGRCTLRDLRPGGMDAGTSTVTDAGP